MKEQKFKCGGKSGIVIGLCLIFLWTGLPSGEESPGPRRVEMRLMQCVEAALQNNREILIERMNVRNADGQVVKAWSDFDPYVTSDASLNDVRQPTGSALSGASVSDQQNLQVNLGLGARVPTGGLLSLQFQNKRTESNSTFQELNPMYSTALVFGVTHPLLRNSGIKTNLYRVHVAKNNKAVSQLALENTVMQTISRVEDAYWQLVLAEENLEVQRLSLQLADEVLEMTRSQVKKGVLPPVAMLQAEAGRSSREESVIIAENAVDTAQRSLQTVINVDASQGTIIIAPADRPAPVQNTPDLEKIIQEAIKNNYQLRQMDYQLRSAGLAKHVNHNLKMPKLDLVASVGTIGLAGDAGNPSTTAFYTGRVIPDPTGASVGLLEFATTTSPANPYNGSYYDSLHSMVSGDYYTWSIGLQFQYPLGNRSARADYSQAMIEEQKLMLQLENTRKLVEMAIRNLAGELLTDIKRVKASQNAQELSLKNMEAEKKKFQLGMNTNRDVLEVQQSYSLALSSQKQALIDYNRILGKLERARMGYLDVSGATAAALPAVTSSITAPTGGMGGYVPGNTAISPAITTPATNNLNLPAGVTLPF